MKSSVYIGTSLDGFIARKDGDFDWLSQFANDEAIHAYEEFLRGVDAIIIGKGTFEKVLGFPSWPYKKMVYVLSHSIEQVPDMLKGKVTLLSMKPEELIGYLSEKGFSSLYIDGGRVIQDFLQLDLIDELIIARVPILIGTGIPLFDRIDRDLPFNHLRTVVQSNGLVRSYYVRIRK
jgi:dihydrofolate reductase